MAYQILVEQYFEFLKRHSGTVEIDGTNVSTGPLAVNGQLLFPTGAWVSADDEKFRAEAPRDPIELIKAKLRYWKAAAARSTSDFHRLKGDATRQASLCLRFANLPGVSGAMLKEMRMLAAMVRRANEEVGRLQSELTELTKDDDAVRRRKLRDEIELREQGKAREVMAEVAAINL